MLLMPVPWMDTLGYDDVAEDKETDRYSYRGR